MKCKIRTLTLLLFTTVRIMVSAQDSVLLTESTICLKHNQSESFYFGFTQNDLILFNVEETNGKSISEVSVSEEEGSLLYHDINTEKVSKRIKVVRENVYEFKITNNNLLKRTYRIRILRIPGSLESANFNTGWEWKVVYDTTYLYYKEDSLVGRDTTMYYEIVKEIKDKRTEEITLVDQNESVKAKGLTGNGNPRVSIEVTLPKEESQNLLNKRIVAWAYWIGVGDNANSAWKNIIKSGATIVGGVYGSQLGAFLAGAVTELALPSNTDQTITYSITDATNRNLFLQGNPFVYIKTGNGSGGYGRIEGNKMSQKKYYINLLNPNQLKKVSVTVKAVALVEITEYENKEYQRQRITPRYVSVTRKEMSITKKEKRINSK